MSEKLQKVLARLGLGSRRGLEEIIAQGRVSVNGVTAKLGDRVEENATVKLDGRTVMSPDTKKPVCRVLMYHKPEGELTTLDDPKDRPTVFDHLPKPPEGRWIYIGRLDINTSGLLLFTTDGELANTLMHPRHGIERVYASRVYGEVTDETVEKLLIGVTLDDGDAHFEKISYVGGEGRNAWYHVTIKEGRKREVRRLWESAGVTVSRLIRIKYAGIELDPALKAGEYRELNGKEINLLRKNAGLKPLDADSLPSDILLPGKKHQQKKPALESSDKVYGGSAPKPRSHAGAGRPGTGRGAGGRDFGSDGFNKAPRRRTPSGDLKSGPRKGPSFKSGPGAPRGRSGTGQSPGGRGSSRGRG